MPTQTPTKIVCTLGPASTDQDTMAELIAAGMDVARINFSHGDHAEHLTRLQTLRGLTEGNGSHIGVIGDLQGPKIRTGTLQDNSPVTLVPGQQLIITTQPTAGNRHKVSTTYQQLPQDVQVGKRILLDDGLLELQVVDTSATEVVCEVIVGGTLGEHKGINLPGVRVSAPSLTEKDRTDLEFILNHDFDYVALSFVRSADDVRQLKQLIAAGDGDLPVIAKLEQPEAMDELDEIVAEAAAVMVARGDLGVELPPEDVPILQKRIIATCSRLRKPVIIATQMLDSMREHPRPTRAEASDVANAIFDGTDAVMLSGETAVGRYPVESVQMMRRIAAAAEREQMRGKHLRTEAGTGAEFLDFADALSRAAARTAEVVQAKAIVAFTQSGSTARLASKCRPHVPIIAATPLPGTARRCSLYWGVQPMIIPPADDTDEMIEKVAQQARASGLVKSGDAIVITAGTPIGKPGTTNMMKLQVIS